jgi:large subunit ribosomal protein L5
MTKIHNSNIEFDKNKLGEELGIKNVMAIPKLKKIVINIGLGEALVNKKAIEIVSKELATITGQCPSVTRAKKDISTFKLRRGEAIGLKVTLRGKRMMDFYLKLVRIVLPRIRDFKGVSLSGFDGRGSYTLGFKEQIVFPEIEYSQIEKVRGMEITLVTTGKDRESTYKLLEKMGMPFKIK